ncbi:MAG TPA: toll/interleukin-1 receptor domain-containing protein [Candidatus Angelobacter sp.]|jgi:tetratricopeptide (TPR) repeat protein|nr:toll/interleukin-1 receptor domain-containing protein [Candidatus Angelobacter sp.]
MAANRPTPPLQVFISYSHQDDQLREKFLAHLSGIRREGLIDAWHDRRISPSGDWAGDIHKHLESAHITIFLVSADFLASDYCNDVEMTRAIERSDAGETRIVPVILKPCDWQTSRFARFQALPKDAKPIVDWPTLDHGFDNVLKGLRRLILELCSPAPVRMQVIQASVQRHPWRWAMGCLLALLLLAGCWLWSESRRYLRQGTALLNVGLYADAGPPIRQAKKLNPLSATADCGLAAVEMDAVRLSNQATFEQRLNQARIESPRCAYLALLQGEAKYLAGDRDGALAEFQSAVQREPQLAEAYFDIGRIFDLQGDADSALKQYEIAARLSPGTARYHNNLADSYFRHEDYDKALAEYGRGGQSPLAALESAKILRLQGKLEDAREHEMDAVRWLKDPAVQSVEAPAAWSFEVSPIEHARLGRIEDKECYASLELSVTRFLQGAENEAADAIRTTFTMCLSRSQDLKSILRRELRQLGSQTPKLGPRCDAITQRFLPEET